jgi:alkaline phosphatase
VPAVAALAAGALAGCGQASAPDSAAVSRRGSDPAAQPARPSARAGSRSVRVVAVGDIACPPGRRPRSFECRQAATAAMARGVRPDAVLALGDLQYERGDLSAFRASFGPSWGRFDRRLRPAPGNHEYATPRAAGYFAYFGAAAGPGRRGYYSFHLGAWHVISLNSNCEEVSCSARSPQVRWLRADLARHRNRCTLAFWHHPRFSSGVHGDQTQVAPLWRALAAARADVVLAGHDHDYERFAPQDASGQAAKRGITEFVVGTGGRSHYPILRTHPTSRANTGTAFGVLALDLRPGGYSWRFVAERGAGFRDAGAARCV